MNKKSLKSPFVSLSLLWGICEISFAKNIIFTRPYQTIEFQTYEKNIDIMDVKYYGDTLALYYPTRDLSKGFKNFKIFNIASTDDYLAFTIVFFSNPNTPQIIDNKTLYSDYFICNMGGLEGMIHSRFIFGLGTKVEQVKDIGFVSTGSNTDVVFLEHGIGFLDFTLLSLNIEYRTTETKALEYYISRAVQTAIIPSDELTATLAPLLTQSLYLSTFNLFSQRMQQLHNNPYMQGVWANITNGGQKSKLGINSNYTSFQAGYDYDFGSQDFSNFIGGGIAYNFSLPSLREHQISIQDQKREFGNLFSHSIALTFYNSYLQGEEGWHNDTILSFQYIQSFFDITNLNRNKKTSNKLGSFALNLYDEFGYRFVLYEDWYIQPQGGFGIGWIAPNSFKQSFEGSDEFLQTHINHTLFLNSKLGSTFGYNLNRFIQNQNFNLSLYLGMFYECDYTMGGDMKLSTTSLSSYHSSPSLPDQHLSLNLGSNINAYKNINLYFDFEKSFFGKTTKDYQVSLGVRYSFGSDTKTKASEKWEVGIKRGYPL